jgi:uncharacterized protein
MPVPTSRSCPKDQTALTPTRLRLRGPEVEVDECSRCGGIFLDADEILHLSGDHALNQQLRQGAPDDHSGRQCPECHVRMEHEYAKGVELEACPRCHGLWLDKGELAKLVGP